MKKLHLFLSFNYYRLYNSSEFETNFFFFGHKFKLNKILFSNKIFITKYNRFFKNFSKKKKIVTHKETRYHKLFIINQKIISNLLGLIFLQKNRLTYSDCFISYLNKELRQVMINKFFFFFSTKILLYNFFFISYVEQYFNYIFLCFFFENEFFKKRQQLIILFNQFLKKEYLYKLSFLGFLFQKNNSLKCRSIFLNSLLNESWSFYKFMDHSPEIHGIKIRIKGRTTARARVKSFMFKRGEVFFQTFKYNLVQHQSVIKTRWGLGSISVWLFLTRFAAIRFNSKVIFKIKPSLCKF